MNSTLNDRFIVAELQRFLKKYGELEQRVMQRDRNAIAEMNSLDKTVDGYLRTNLPAYGGFLADFGLDANVNAATEDLDRQRLKAGDRVAKLKAALAIIEGSTPLSQAKQLISDEEQKEAWEAMKEAKAPGFKGP